MPKKLKFMVPISCSGKCTEVAIYGSLGVALFVTIGLYDVLLYLDRNSYSKYWHGK